MCIQGQDEKFIDLKETQWLLSSTIDNNRIFSWDKLDTGSWSQVNEREGNTSHLLHGLEMSKETIQAWQALTCFLIHHVKYLIKLERMLFTTFTWIIYCQIKWFDQHCSIVLLFFILYFPPSICPTQSTLLLLLLIRQYALLSNAWPTSFSERSRSLVHPKCQRRIPASSL